MTTAPAQQQTDLKPNAFVGRQAIFNGSKQVFGYELLFRSNHKDNFCGPCDGDQASCITINNTLNVMGLTTLSNGRKAFVNITRQLLVNEVYRVLPASDTIIELLETVKPDRDVVKACGRLKENGYQLALDDFVSSPGFEPLLEMADFVKIDFLSSNDQQRAGMVEQLAKYRTNLLAEKVETINDFQTALNLGYDYFQGYFFCKPEIVSGREVPQQKRNYMRFLMEVMRPEIDFALLERIVKEEPSLSIKLLRYLNSAMVGMRTRIESIRQGLTLLGQAQLKQWAALVAMTGMASDKPSEVMTMCLVRARFCELLAASLKMNGRELDMFLMGLVSGVDGLLDRPMSDILAEMPLPPDVVGALTGTESTLGNMYGLMLACERGNQRIGALLAKKVNIDYDLACKMFCDSMLWADRVLHQR